MNNTNSVLSTSSSASFTSSSVNSHFDKIQQETKEKASVTSRTSKETTSFIAKEIFSSKEDLICCKESTTTKDPYWLGVLYDPYDTKGDKAKKNVEKALYYYILAAGQGDLRAQFQLALMYEEGRGLEQDDAKAINWYEKVAKQGNSDSQYNLGLMYDQKKEYEKAIYWFKEAAKQGDSDAQHMLGLMYEEGVGVKQDVATAVKYYKQAADKNHIKARNRLIKIYLKKMDVHEIWATEDHAEVVDMRETIMRYVLPAAEQDHTDACHIIATIYYYGLYGIPQNLKQAAKYHEKLAHQGDREAMTRFGRHCSFFGPYDKAFYWLTEAVELGHPDAMGYLAQMYRDGVGVSRDEQKATYWFQLASSHDK